MISRFTDKCAGTGVGGVLSQFDDAIFAPATCDAVQAMLAEHRKGERTRIRAASPSLLAGRLVDADGEPLTPTHANKSGRRYRYYISRSLQAGSDTGLRMPALELETAVAQRVAEAFDDPFALAGAAQMAVRAEDTASLMARAGRSPRGCAIATAR